MKIKNTSSKVISVGPTVILPDAEAAIDKTYANTPAVKALIGRGFLTVLAVETEADEKKTELKNEVDSTESAEKAETVEKVEENSSTETKETVPVASKPTAQKPAAAKKADEKKAATSKK